MKKARFAVLILTVAVPLIFFSLYFHELSEIRKGTSARMEAEVRFNLERILNPIPNPKGEQFPGKFADPAAVKALKEGFHQATPLSSAEPTPQNEPGTRTFADELLEGSEAPWERYKNPPRVEFNLEDYKNWKQKRIQAIIEHWLTRIRENPQSIPLEIQKYVAQAKQQALDKTASQYQLLGVILVGPLIMLGLVSSWVMSPGLARSRLRLLAQVSLAGWTVIVALALAFNVEHAHSVSAQITQAVALWIAGVVPGLLVLYWTRPPQN